MQRKKLIEVALPLDAINAASAREKSIRHGHPSTLHLWWARRPLATARAVIFAQMVDDPASRPELFPTEQAQEQERRRLFNLIEQLVKWENTTNEEVMQAARDEIRESWRRICADNADHPHAGDLFNPEGVPALHDPFAGGGTIPLEAQRLGLEAHASDLNPVAVLINKAMIEIPPKFASRPPVNPESRSEGALLAGEWSGARGLAEDVRYYGHWMRDEAVRRIGHLYPTITITDEMALKRPDLESYTGRELTVIAWLWARTVRSPNPAFREAEIPLVSTFILSKKEGKEAYVVPEIDAGGYRFTVNVGKPPAGSASNAGTGAGKRQAFRCLMSGVPVTYEYIRDEGRAGRMGSRLMAIVAEGDRGRVYLTPTDLHQSIAKGAEPEWRPDVQINHWPGRTNVVEYGLTSFGDLFTPRQLVALNTFSDLVADVRGKIEQDAITAGLQDDDQPLRLGGTAAAAYADAVSVYLSFMVNQVANHSSTVCGWNNVNTQMRSTFARQAIPMIWDFAESNPFCESSGSYANLIERQIKGFEAIGHRATGAATQENACDQSLTSFKIVCTDPPYYDNIGYADLSDFFYVWLRRSQRTTFPELFTTLVVPKDEELIVTPYRHNTKEEAEGFFLDGMTRAVLRIREQAHPCFPITIFYAFKQAESTGEHGARSTGWETFLDAVIRAGLSVSGTWPTRTEKQGRVMSIGRNALASSVVLVCRQRAPDAPISTRRDLIAALKAELPSALAHLQRGNIAPVDFAQAAIGPGMAIYTSYAKVLDAAGNLVSVGEALALINQTLDEIVAEQEGDFDADSRWALAWFDQHGFDAGDYGMAETLSKAKNTSVTGMVEAGIVHSREGKVRLLRPQELPTDWDPTGDNRLTTWEMVHHLIRVLEQGGESAAAELVRTLGGFGEVARELCYRLYTVCERKKRAAEALAYNGLVQSWPEISRLARAAAPAEQASLFDGDGTGADA